MLTRTECENARREAAALIRAAGIHHTPEEESRIEVADLGLNDLRRQGVQILTLFSTERVSAKVIALLPHQTMPEHLHPCVVKDPGKEETVRVAAGLVRFYLPGEDTLTDGFIPEGKAAWYASRHEYLLSACDRLTIPPGTPHWFQAGPAGAVLYSISTCARDVLDLFTDPEVVRTTVIKPDGEEPGSCGEAGR